MSTTRKNGDAVREQIFERDDYTCVYCEVYALSPGRQVQLAHLIPNTKDMISRYGKDVIDHPRNRVTTCSLECNNAVQLTNKPVEADALASEILGDISDSRV